MSTFATVAALITLAAGFSYANYRWLKWPTTTGLMALALAFSLALIGVGHLFPAVEQEARAGVERVDFTETLLHGMLGFLLFAGALHVELNDLGRHKLVIATLSTVGVLISTFLVGALAWCVLPWLGLPMSFLSCLLFGALISPTDPVAVLAMLKQAGAPRALGVQIAGESLFNDGVGVVLFVGLLQIASGPQGVEPASLAILFGTEAVGGILYGLGVGLLAYALIKSVDNSQVEILLSLALVAGGYALAEALHVSGPLAMVVAGLLIGNQGRAFAMSPTTCDHLDLFWKLVDEILNAVLFVLIGLVVLVLSFPGRGLLAGLAMVPVVLLARLVSVALPAALLRRRQAFSPSAILVLTWGGLRGGISVALALSLPPAPGRQAAVPEREVILTLTYVVVAFSILVQGLTVKPLIRQALRRTGQGEAHPARGFDHT
jgi:CPA1 family monovalent cation:H+ antiporter